MCVCDVFAAVYVYVLCIWIMAMNWADADDERVARAKRTRAELSKVGESER